MTVLKSNVEVPDGGWGWAVVGGAAMTNVSLYLKIYCLGRNSFFIIVYNGLLRQTWLNGNKYDLHIRDRENVDKMTWCFLMIFTYFMI